MKKRNPNVDNNIFKSMDNINLNCVFEKGWTLEHAQIYYHQLKALADYLLEYNLEDVCNKVNEIMMSGKRYVIIATSEAAKEKGKEETIARIVKDSFEQKRYGGIAEKLAYEIEQKTGHEARAMVLGHIQRGGEPCTSDIILGARLGDYALNLLADGRTGYIVGVKESGLVKMKFPKTREARLLDLDTNDVYRTAKDMGIYFGINDIEK